MFLPLVACVFLDSSAMAVDWENFKGEDYEEPAGGSVAVLLNPQDNIYGLAFGDGTWLKNTPVFGDFGLSMFSNGIEDSFYSGVSMTIRLMPHWRFAPFAGGGGSYNYSLSQSSEEDSTSETKEFKDQGDSYWGYHAEAGLRVRTPQGIMLFELMGRYVWTSLEEDRNYWLAGISVGAGIGD
jgi:hypothetical protein